MVERADNDGGGDGDNLAVAWAGCARTKLTAVSRDGSGALWQ